jgi:tetratricopeptide (TPR) repeat protein
MLPTNIGESGVIRTARNQVVGLFEHRSRRNQRLALARAMQSGDPVRAELVERLAELATLTGGDRAAAVWIDEYEDGAVHAFVTLDLLQDHPRRTFALEPLERAWERGLPGVYEGKAGSVATADEGSTQLAVALGSDGARAWFIVTDSVRAVKRMSAADREQALFLAGECAAALLHRDLDAMAGGSGGAGAGFVGRPMLDDWDENEGRPELRAKLEQRFLLLRMGRSVVEEGVGFETGRAWDERVEAARTELLERAAEGAEPEGAWTGLVDALRLQRLGDLARELLKAGERAERDGHAHGALEFYRCAFDAAAKVMDPSAAADAAALQGRVLRRSAEWDASSRAYQRAHGIALAVEDWARVARVLVGLAAVRQEMGSLPDARTRYHEALDMAQRAAAPEVLAIAHHGLLGLEHAAGDFEAALRHGWTAVGAYQERAGRVRCLASLAGVLVDYGDRSAGEDAWTVVAREAEDVYYLVYAHDALAYLAALRGDLHDFQRHAAACDRLGWESGPRSAKAEVLLYRGLSYGALHMPKEARSWLERAVEFSEGFGFNRTLFRAEEALRVLDRDETGGDRRRSPPQPERVTPSAPTEIRDGLREMRSAAAVVFPQPAG